MEETAVGQKRHGIARGHQGWRRWKEAEVLVILCDASITYQCAALLLVLDAIPPTHTILYVRSMAANSPLARAAQAAHPAFGTLDAPANFVDKPMTTVIERARHQSERSYVLRFKAQNIRAQAFLLRREARDLLAGRRAPGARRP